MLSICILNYNGKEYLENCLKSVPSDLKAERILIDNASTDESWKIAENYGFRVVHANNEHKFITGINRAITEANGEYILFSQADLEFLPGAIEILYSAAIFNQNAIIQPVFLRNERIDNAGMRWIWPGYGVGELKIDFINPWHKTDIATSITFITRRDLFEKVGLYDEKFSPAYYEDVDMALRTQKINIIHLVSHAAKIWHYHNKSFSTIYRKKEISDICRKNRKYLINKHYKGIDRWLRLAVTSCIDIVKKAFDIITDRRIPADNRK